MTFLWYCYFARSKGEGYPVYRDVPTVVNTDHHSHKIATTTTQQNHYRFNFDIHKIRVYTVFLDSCSHHYSKSGHIPECRILGGIGSIIFVVAYCK